jgi:carbon storage regulator
MVTISAHLQGGFTMLIITPKAGEKFIIDHDIEVTVLACKGNQVKIGIDAPEDLDIIREELIIQDWTV